MRKKPTIHKRTPISNTGIFRIEKMDLEFANGQTRCYQRILGSKQGAVMVVPLLDDDTVLLIREYAAGMDRYELAFAKGHIERDEDMLSAANRELQEEAGYAANRLEHLHSVTAAPGYLCHTTHVVLARDLYPQRLDGDEPEPIDVVPWRVSELELLLQRGDFTEARSIAAFFLLRDRLAQDVGA